MIYTDRPALQFWTDYLDEEHEMYQDRAVIWQLDPNQGFIEGALRSAARVISFFVNGEAGTEFSDRVFLSTNALRRDPVFD